MIQSPAKKASAPTASPSATASLPPRRNASSVSSNASALIARRRRMPDQPDHALRRAQPQPDPRADEQRDATDEPPERGLEHLFSVSRSRSSRPAATRSTDRSHSAQRDQQPEVSKLLAAAAAAVPTRRVAVVPCDVASLRSRRLWHRGGRGRVSARLMPRAGHDASDDPDSRRNRHTACGRRPPPVAWLDGELGLRAPRP